jgi:RNA polymerase sigma-70 factor (ECF subfamily)
MLQVVLGLSGDRIASAFLTSPLSMTKRLTRAKAKIREAGIAFQVLSPAHLQGRLESVLAAIYAAYGLGWEATFGSGGKHAGLAQEAIWLGRLVVGLLPIEPEPKGLLALMLFSEARRGARRNRAGAFVPVGVQDLRLWSLEMIDEAEVLLKEASRAGRMGRYQLEAAIQAVHAQRRHRGHTDWHSILVLYDGLLCLSQSMGARVGRAAALCESGQPEAALTELDQIEAAMVTAYQPFWATRAHVLQALNRLEEANSAFARAAGLSEDAAVRSYLLSRSRGLDS